MPSGFPEASQQPHDMPSAGMQPSLMDTPEQGTPRPIAPAQQPMTSSGSLKASQQQYDAPAQQLPPMPEFQDLPPAPTMQQEQYPAEPYPQEQAGDYREQMDEIEALIESVIDEKWQSMLARVGNLDTWKQKIRTDVQSIKQELVRIQTRFENIEKAVLGKISQYDKNIANVGAEIKAMEKVLQKVMEPMTTNIKELKKLTAKLKTKH